MKTYLTFEGEQPMYLNDFVFMQNAVKEVVVNMMNALSPDEPYVIWQGVNVTSADGKTSWTAGVVSVDGIMYRVLPGSVAQEGATLYFSKKTIYDPAGVRVFKNGVTHNCYEEEVQDLVTTPTSEALEDFVRLDASLARVAQEKRYKILTSSGAFCTGQIIKDASGALYIQGFLEGPALGVSLTTILPSSVVVGLPPSEVKSYIGKKTYTTLAYFSSKNTSQSYPVRITLSEDASEVRVQVDFAGQTSISLGGGQFYCRLYNGF